MDELDVFELSCSHCGETFHVCRRDYRGQGYCSEPCRELAQGAIRRRANAKHQRSLRTHTAAIAKLAAAIAKLEGAIANLDAALATTCRARQA